MKTSTKPFFHFSVDDVFDCLYETAQYSDIFQQPTLQFLKEINQQYNTNIELYLFYRKSINNGIKTLRDVPYSHRKTIASIPWLSFGPHALDYETAPYNQTPQAQIKTYNKIYKEIHRFADKSRVSKFIRLHYYSESFELASYFRKRNVEGLFSTDRPNGSHRMPEFIGQQLIKSGQVDYEGMKFLRTSFRLEFLADQHITKNELIKQLKKTLTQYGFVIVYTHECEFARQEVRNVAHLVLSSMKELGIPSK